VTKFVNELVEAADAKQRSRTIAGPRLCTAIVDRLAFNGTIIETGTDTYRLARTRSKAGQ
jgi:hypothetical protein